MAAALWRNTQSCLTGPSKPSENKIAALGSTKRLRWSHYDYLCLVRRLRSLSCGILPCMPTDSNEHIASYYRSKVIVSSLRRGSFCTAFGSYFVLLLSCLPAGQTRRMWMVRQGSSLTWLSIRIRLQRRKPGESNKLFDLIVLPQDTIRPIRSIRGRNTNRKHSGAWRALL